MSSGLRDMFAARALSAIIISDEHSDWPDPMQVAELAYEFANAMLAARARKHRHAMPGPGGCDAIESGPLCVLPRGHEGRHSSVPLADVRERCEDADCGCKGAI